MLKCARTNPNGFSSYETNIACPSAVTISSFAYNRPNADQAGWTVSKKSRVKNSTGDLLLTLAGANSSFRVRLDQELFRYPATTRQISWRKNEDCSDCAIRLAISALNIPC